MRRKWKTKMMWSDWYSLGNSNLVWVFFIWKMSSNIIESLRELFSWKVLVGIGTYHTLPPYLVLDVVRYLPTQNSRSNQIKFQRFIVIMQDKEWSYAPQIHNFFYFNYGYIPQILNLIFEQVVFKYRHSDISGQGLLR